MKTFQCFAVDNSIILGTSLTHTRNTHIHIHIHKIDNIHHNGTAQAKLTTVYSKHKCTCFEYQYNTVGVGSTTYIICMYINV